MKHRHWLFFAFLLAQGCSVKPFDAVPATVPPDYSADGAWAALPWVPDNADRTPSPEFKDLQQEAQVDVFFLHPTLYLEKSSKPWNASIGDAKLNQKVDESTILFQASCFNGAGRVFAPRYRQAHYRSFFTKDKASAEKALELAYQDLKTAFEYYLEHHNQNRPIIIAAHSQGTRHGLRLLKEMFDGKPLQRKLVAAYLVGWPIPQDAFKQIRPCASPNDTGCFCSWRSFKHGFEHKKYPQGDSIVVTNPLTWKLDGEYAPKERNSGTVLREFGQLYPRIADAQAHNGLLWVHKPKFPGSFFFRRKNYHIADYNLFYVSIRENAIQRVGAFWK